MMKFSLFFAFLQFNMTASDIFGEGKRIAELKNRRIAEASGIAASRLNDDIIWFLNDRGNAPVIYAVGMHGKDIAEVRLNGARNKDWEDIASFQKNGTSYLLIADVGDNSSRKKKCTLYLIKEPVLDSKKFHQKRKVPVAACFNFVYEDGARDCESVAVDPKREEILLLSKRTVPPVLYSLPLLLKKTPELMKARRVCELNKLPLSGSPDWQKGPVQFRFLGVPTAMDISSDGTILAVLTYKNIYLYAGKGGSSWRDFIEAEPFELKLPPLKQAEALCFNRKGDVIFVSSEKRPTPLIKFLREH